MRASSNAKRFHRRLMAVLTVSVAMGAAVSASAQTSSWQQRVDPSELPAPKAVPEQRKVDKAAKPKAAKPKTAVQSQEIAPSAQPSVPLPGAAKGPTLKSGLAKPLGPMSGSGAAASASGSDPAYEAFDQGRYLTALDLAQKAAEKGEPQAYTLVGRIHNEGLGVSKSPETAAKWFAKGAELGDIEAAFSLGVLYAQGQGVQRNYPEAARFLEMAAAKGHPHAVYNLALLFLRGQGKNENPTRAFHLMEYAAQRGVVAAQYDLGTLYTTGVGTEANAFKGATWIAKAARAGHPEAEMDYALILFKVDADPKDKDEVEQQLAAKKQGLELFRSAAQKGVPIALNRLARCYHLGEGVAADPIEAAKWHILARQAGLDDEMLEKAMAKLSKADRLKAEQAADEWRDKSQIQ